MVDQHQQMSSAPRKALIAGHFSTLGDLECLSIVRAWLTEQGLACDTAAFSSRIRERMPGSVDARTIDTRRYSHLVVVCGPCWPELVRKRGLDFSRFNHCVKIGINLTMIEPVETWNPFDVLIERDSNRTARPDLAFLAESHKRTLAGRCFIQSQPEYGDRQRHQLAIAALDQLVLRAGMTAMPLDTRWGNPDNPIRNTADFSALLSRCDVMLTNRLHGLVLAIREGVPVIALDGIAGGDKVTSQAKSIGWPKVICADQVTSAWLDDALAWCLSPEGRRNADACRERACQSLAPLKSDFASALGVQPQKMASPDSLKQRLRSFFGLR